MSHPAGVRTRLIRALAAAAIVLTVVAIPTAPAGRVQAAGTCALPLTHDPYGGFHIGVPTGWSLSSYQDTIVVARDAAGTEEAVVYPAVQTAGLTPAAFFAAYMHTLQGLITAAGNALAYRMISGPGQLPQAIVTGHAGTVPVQGRATVTRLRYPTALGANQLVFSAYWAPPARPASESALLASIGRCYGPEAGTIYQVFQDQVFAFALPAGWKVTDEGQDTIDLTGDGGRAYAGYLLTLLPTGAAGSTPASLLDAIFARLHIQLTSTIFATNGPSSLTTEFLGSLGGKAVHGLVYATVSAGSGGTAGTIRLALATADQWNSQNSGLIKIATSIRHSMAQDQRQWQDLMQQWRQFDQTTRQFDDALNGVEEVRDPTTGKLYAASYDAYQRDNPAGPGYYLNKGGYEQRLEPVPSQ